VTLKPGLVVTVSEINGDFTRKSQNFPNPVYFAPLDGVPLAIGYRRTESKNQNDVAVRLSKSFKIGLAV